MPRRRSKLRRILPVLVVVLFVAVLAGGSSPAGAYCMLLADDSGGGCEPPSFNNPSTLSNTVTAPRVGATVDGIVAITANPGGVKNAEVNRVEFYVDNVLIGIDLANPWRTDWNTLDPNFVAYDGTHSLTSIAYTNTGRATSPAVSVTVANTVGTQYRAAITSTPVPQEIDYNPSGAQATYPVDVTIRNNSTFTWSTTSVKLNYRWYSPDPTPVVTNGVAVSFTSSVLAGSTRTLRVNVVPPTLTTGISKAQYQLRFDLIENGVTWFASKGNAPLENPVIDAKALEAEALGLERYYHYEGEDIGAGMQHLLNVANGNSLLRWTPWQLPGRGLSTVVDITYNSFEKKCECPLGNNFSLSISTLARLGLPLDIHPNNADTIAGRSNRYIVFTDGDGTPHKFIGKQALDNTVYWEEPAGVHLYLRSITTDPLAPRYWAITRPDRVTWYFDKEGYPTSVEDRNGNTITFTLTAVQPGDDPGGVKKRITKITDAGGDFVSIDYFTKAEVKKPQIRGKVQSLTDHGGHRLLFDYYADGNLRKIIQEAGVKADGFSYLPARTLVFTYTTSDGSGPAIPTAALRVDPDPETHNQSTRIYSVRDPRGMETLFTYYGPTSGQLRWRLQSRSDRSGKTTNYAYDLTNRVATITDPLSFVTKFAYDVDGMVTKITDPKSQVTTVEWTPDRKVKKVTEPGGAFREWAYNDNGYLVDEWDQLRNQTHLDYQHVAVDANDVGGKWRALRSIPHISQLAKVTSPRGMATPAVANDYETLFAYDPKGNILKVTGPEGHPSPSDPDGQFWSYNWNLNGTIASQTDPNSHTTTFVSYDNQGLVTEEHDALGRITKYGYDKDGQLRWIQDPRHALANGPTPSHYRIEFGYDSFHRLGRQSAPKWYANQPGVLVISEADFDANDNVTSRIQPYYSGAVERFTTKFDYDAMDRLVQTTSPDTSIDPVGERIQRQYDAGGRLIKQIRPKGVLTAAPDDFVTAYAYDELDRVVRETRHETGAAGNITKSLHTHYCYDLAGDLRAMTRPKADLAQVDCAAIIANSSKPPFTTTWTYDLAHQRLAETNPLGFTKSVTYDENGNVNSETNELGYSATKAYDQRDLLIKLVEPVEPGTLGTGNRKATTRYFYDPVGNRIKEVSPRGWDASPDPEPNKTTFRKYFTTYEYDAVDQRTRVVLPTDPDDPNSEQHYLHTSYDELGSIEWTSLQVKEGNPVDVKDEDKTVQTYFDTNWVRTTTRPGQRETTFEYRPEGWQSERTPAGKPTERWTYFPDQVVKVHTDSETKTTTFAYDANNNVTRVDDQSGGSGTEKPIDVVVTVDSLDRRTKVVQKKQGQSFWLFTTMTYDLNGNVLVREDDGRQDPTTGNVTRQPRKNEFTYDQADWVSQQLDRGRASGCDDDRRITTEYFNTGWLRLKKVERGTAPCGWSLKVETTKDYYANGRLQKLVTKNGAGEVKESHDLSYVDDKGFYANGNRTKDTFVRSKPGGGDCTSASCVQQWYYDAEDRLVKWDNGRSGITQYTLDPHGNISRQVEPSGTTNMTYNGDQLETVTANGLTSEYWYDGSGNLDCVTDSGGSQANCPQAATDTAPGHVLEDWTYDGLERAKDHHNYVLGDSAAYTYDAFDRMATEDEKHSGSSKTTSFEYLGMSGRVTTENQSGSSNSTKDYSYDAWGNRVSLKSSGDQAGDWDYGYDGRGSISMLLTQAGSAQMSYGYEPYGDKDEGLTAGDPSRTNPINAYRYDSKRLDPGSGTLQMGARMFSPSTSRFTQGDLYKGALADLDLSFDPLTQNRYSLAGGNPINFVEVDGHWPDFVDDAVDAVGDAASAAVDAVAGVASYCLGEGAANCAAVAGGIALVATGVGAVAGAGAIAAGAGGVAAAATVAEVGFESVAAARDPNADNLTALGLSLIPGPSPTSLKRAGDAVDLVNTGSKLQRRMDQTIGTGRRWLRENVTGGEHPISLIGEDMAGRVVPQARKLRRFAGGRQIRTIQDDLGRNVNFKQNENWIRREVRRGADVWDIGRAESRVRRGQTSDWWSMERFWTDGYRGYKRVYPGKGDIYYRWPRVNLRYLRAKYMQLR